MWIEAARLVVGLAALCIGAELFVNRASALGVRFGLSPIVIGLTVVAFGTSSPELAVTLGAVFSGEVDVGVGNIVGSNIANLLLVLGLAALIARLSVCRSILRFDLPFMIATTVVFILCAIDGRLAASDGWILMLLFGLYALRLFRGDAAPQVDEEPLPSTGHSTLPLVLALGCGLALLVVGADWMVDGAVAIAAFSGLEPVIIGMTIVAIGTSLPEIATSLVALLRGNQAMVIGNAIGSNILNIVLVVGLSTVVSGGGLEVHAAIIGAYFPWMLAAALVCVPIFLSSRAVVRWEGVVLILGYVAFSAYLAVGSSVGGTS